VARLVFLSRPNIQNNHFAPLNPASQFFARYRLQRAALFKILPRNML
jgi:hypothetical protein